MTPITSTRATRAAQYPARAAAAARRTLHGSAPGPAVQPQVRIARRKLHGSAPGPAAQRQVRQAGGGSGLL